MLSLDAAVAPINVLATFVPVAVALPCELSSQLKPVGPTIVVRVPYEGDEDPEPVGPVAPVFVAVPVGPVMPVGPVGPVGPVLRPLDQ